MEVSFKKDSAKKYVCSICETQFNWDNGSSRYGKEDEEPEAVFCSSKCAKKYLKNI